MTTKQLLALVATIIGSGVVLLDSTVINLALPVLAKELGAKFAQLQWVVDGYLLSLSALILVGGSLGDIFGRKKIYMIGLAGFGLSSAVCGLAPNTTFLIVARVVQGAFGALLVPGGLAIINTNFSQDLRGQAIGRWAGWSGVATAVGPPLFGYFLDNASWRWIFFLNIPLIVICLLLTVSYVSDSKDEKTRSVDTGGALLAAVSLAGMTYALIEGPGRQWDRTIIMALIGGAAFFAAFLTYEARKKDPLVNFDLFRSRNFAGANIATLAMYGGLNAFFFSLLIHLQTGVGLSSTVTGLSLLPVTFLLLIMSGTAGKLAGRYGPRLFMTIGPLIAGAGIFLLLDYSAGSSYFFHLIPGLCLFGFGLGLTVAPLTITVMSSVNPVDSGIASGINNAIARIAGLLAVAALGLLGADNAYRFGIYLSGTLALSAGVISRLLICDGAAPPSGAQTGPPGFSCAAPKGADPP